MAHINDFTAPNEQTWPFEYFQRSPQALEYSRLFYEQQVKYV